MGFLGACPRLDESTAGVVDQAPAEPAPAEAGVARGRNPRI